MLAALRWCKMHGRCSFLSRRGRRLLESGQTRLLHLPKATASGITQKAPPRPTCQVPRHANTGHKRPLTRSRGGRGLSQLLSASSHPPCGLPSYSVYNNALLRSHDKTLLYSSKIRTQRRPTSLTFGLHDSLARDGCSEGGGEGNQNEECDSAIRE